MQWTTTNYVTHIEDHTRIIPAKFGENPFSSFSPWDPFMRWIGHIYINLVADHPKIIHAKFGQYPLGHLRGDVV